MSSGGRFSAPTANKVPSCYLAILLHILYRNFVFKLKSKDKLVHHEENYLYGSLGIIPFRLLQ